LIATIGPMLLLSTPTPSPASGTANGLSAGEAAILAATIAAVVSIIGLIFSAILQSRALKSAAARDVANAMLDFRLRQLNDLYGPLFLLLEQSERLAKKLRESLPDPQEDWRLLDHMDEVKADPQMRAVVEMILEIGEKIEGLLLSRAGLALSPGPPATFGLYLGHVAIMKSMFRDNLRPKIAEHDYYPRQLNRDVKDGYDSIQREIDDLRSLYGESLESALKRRTRRSSP
jgi:hypothetical protein